MGCVCVCVYVCVFVCIYTYIYAYTHLYIYIHRFIHKHINTNTYTHTHIHTHDDGGQEEERQGTQGPAASKKEIPLAKARALQVNAIQWGIAVVDAADVAKVMDVPDITDVTALEAEEAEENVTVRTGEQGDVDAWRESGRGDGAACGAAEVEAGKATVDGCVAPVLMTDMCKHIQACIDMLETRMCKHIQTYGDTEIRAQPQPFRQTFTTMCRHTYKHSYIDKKTYIHTN